MGNRMAACASQPPESAHSLSVPLYCESNGGKYRPDIRKEEKMDRKRSSFCPNFGGEWEMPGRARARAEEPS